MFRPILSDQSELLYFLEDDFQGSNRPCESNVLIYLIVTTFILTSRLKEGQVHCIQLFYLCMNTRSPLGSHTDASHTQLVAVTACDYLQARQALAQEFMLAKRREGMMIHAFILVQTLASKKQWCK